MGFITDLAKSWMEAAQDQGISALAPPSTDPGPDDLVCASICDIVLRILEEDSSMHTPGSALKRTSLFGICSFLGGGLLSSGCQCLLLLPDSGETFPCASLVLILLPAPPKVHTSASSSCYSQCLPRYPAQSSQHLVWCSDLLGVIARDWEVYTGGQEIPKASKVEGM